MLVDLPGVQRPRDALTERMQRRVERELAESDAALLVLNGEEGVGPGDRFIAAAAAALAVPVVVAVNKLDRLDRAADRSSVLAAPPTSASATTSSRSRARTGDGRPGARRPPRRARPREAVPLPARGPSDQPEDVLLAELVREQVLRRTFQEVPHAVEVVIETSSAPREDLTRVRALVWVETESQKGILIGAGGRMVKSIGTAARRELERELGTACTSTSPSASAAAGAATSGSWTASASSDGVARPTERRRRGTLARAEGGQPPAPRGRAPEEAHAERPPAPGRKLVPAARSAAKTRSAPLGRPRHKNEPLTRRTLPGSSCRPGPAPGHQNPPARSTKGLHPAGKGDGRVARHERIPWTSRPRSGQGHQIPVDVVLAGGSR